MPGMIHQGQCLTLGLKPRDHLPRVHSRLDHLQGHLAAHRLLLLGDENQPKAPLADLLHEFIWADDCARSLEGAGCVPGDAGRRNRLLEELAQVVVGEQQGVDARPEVCVALAGAVEVARRSSSGRSSRASQKIALSSGLIAAMGLPSFVCTSLSAPSRPSLAGLWKKI